MQLYDELTDKIQAFIAAQNMFFVATAPLDGTGHVNLSPKGYDSFKVIDRHTVAYLDLGGSGIETQAHVRENGRITIMFCAFEGAPNILRLYGRGEVVQFDDPRFTDLLALFPGFEQARAIFTVKLDRIQDSCGWGVPFYDFKGERDQLKRYADNEKMTAEDWADKYRTRNAESIDGLPGIAKN
ncbi:MAG: pyridoxamine 5'-phosphate oxidase family protein [Alphaproteobacteria bacterium]|nr:pyridoxamine 5'-phosphate oxidase family protein [Alphaproteobacteria bacterium]